jgi:hypothetical protein
LERQKEEKDASRAGGLCVFRLVLERLGYGTCSIFNADPSSLCRPFNRSLHHRRQVDDGVTAPKAHQHVVGHCLCQSVALLLQAAANNLLQLGYLPNGQVKKREYNASLWCHVPAPDRPEAEGRQSSVCLAQETPDVLCFPARDAWRSSNPFWTMASSRIYRSASCRSRAASLASWSLDPGSRLSTSSSWARI